MQSIRIQAKIGLPCSKQCRQSAQYKSVLPCVDIRASTVISTRNLDSCFIYTELQHPRKQKNSAGFFFWIISNSCTIDLTDAMHQHTGFGLSVDGRVITSITRKCSSCSSPFCRKVHCNCQIIIQLNDPKSNPAHCLK